MNNPRLSSPALLLIGPTGSGKTPLGDMIEARELWKKNWLHFDFGATLREIVTCNRADEWVTTEDLAFLRNVLGSGALLEDEQFPLAERILVSFFARRKAGASIGVVLNGLPRHVGQAEKLEEMIHVETVVELVCDSETALARIRGNIGGDRKGRSDDDLPSVVRKMEIYRQRTVPLVEFYRRRGVRVLPLEITVNSNPATVWEELNQMRE